MTDKESNEATQASKGIHREVYFHRMFEVGVSPDNKDLTGITAGMHTLVFPIEMAEGLAIHIMRVCQAQREAARTGDYDKLYKNLKEIKFCRDEMDRQQAAFEASKISARLREDT